MTGPCERCLDRLPERTGSSITTGFTLIFTVFICVVSGLVIRTEGKLERFDDADNLWEILLDPYVATIIVYGVWSVSSFQGFVGSVYEFRSLLVTFSIITISVLLLHVAAYVFLFTSGLFSTYFFTPLHTTLFMFGIGIIIIETYGQVFVIQHIKTITRKGKLKLIDPPARKTEDKIYFTSDFKRSLIESPLSDGTRDVCNHV